MQKAYFKLHFSIFLFGFTSILGKWITLGEGPLVWYRMGLTAGAYLVWLTWRRQITWVGLREGLRLGMVGMLLALHWICFFGSIKYSTVSVALVCFSTGPLFTAVLDPLFNRRRIEGFEILLGLVIILGVYMVYTFRQFYAVGILLGLGAALTNALYGIFNKKLVRRHSEHTVNFYEISIGWLFFTLVAPILLAWLPAGTGLYPTSIDWILLLVLALVCTNYAYNLSLSALRVIEPFHYLLAINLEAIYGIVLAMILLQENRDPDPGFLTGTFLILASVFAYPVLKRIFRPDRLGV